MIPFILTFAFFIPAFDSLAANPDLDKKLVKAVAKRDFDKAQGLLKDGADPNAKDGDGIPALELSLREYEKHDVYRGNFSKKFAAQRIFGALLRGGADFKQGGILWRVLKRDVLRQEHFLWMLERGEAKDWRFAFNAADGNKMHGEDSIVDPMLARCAEIYREGENCAGALPAAVRRGADETAGKLLDKGAAVDGPDEYGRTALYFAAENGNLALAKKLLGLGATPNPPSQPESGIVWSPLAAAAFSRSRALAELLIEKGADLDAALRFAAREKRARPASPWADAVASLEKFADNRAGGPGASGLSKDELASVVRSAVAASQTAAKEAPREPSSEVDSPAYKHPERPEDFAVVVGIEKYSEVPDAQFAARDAESVKRHLLAMGLPARNVVHLSGDKAGYKALEKFIEAWLPRNVTEKSRVFFYFSGHGAPDPSTGQSYLLPWDGDPSFLENTGYPLARLYDKLGALKAKAVVVALDACFSGAGGRSALAKGARPLVTKAAPPKLGSDRLVVLAAASADQITSTREDQGHGTFTYHFLKGLSGGGKGGGGAVTARSLYDYLKPRVQDDARRQNREQIPALQGLADLELIAPR